MRTQKRVMAIHDISCLGKCSLTVVLPILSVMGIETSIIPTAVLSTHTGEFSDFTYRDLTTDILPIVKHWESLSVEFDAIYTGYLGSFEQLNIVENIFKIYKGKSLIMVDPVMADHGELYSGFTPDFIEGMKHLCSYAHIIVPNLTEACLMLGEKFVNGIHSKAYIEDILKRLADMGPEKVVLTGVWLDDTQYGTAAYDKATGEISYAFANKIDGVYYGTGDIFASVVLGEVIKGRKLEVAIRRAVDYTSQCILRTYKDGTPPRFGVNFEDGLASLAD